MVLQYVFERATLDQVFRHTVELIDGSEDRLSILEVVLRSALLFLSKQAALRRWMETSRAAKRLTERFIAGDSLVEELAVCARLNAEGILASVDYLGENVRSLEEAEASRDIYLKIIEAISGKALNATVSIKLTQFGLDFSEEACRANVERVVERAQATGNRVEIDMESSDYVDRTLDLVVWIHERHGGVRAVIQAYLYRSSADIDRLNEHRIPVRLCKGAYREPPSVAFTRKSDVDANYVVLMEKLLRNGACPAIASHDERILKRAIEFVEMHSIPAHAFEFQMLYGIRRDLQRELLAAHYRLRLYVPYGDAWYPYFMRRLAERPANLLFLARNFFRS